MACLGIGPSITGIGRSDDPRWEQAKLSNKGIYLGFLAPLVARGRDLARLLPQIQGGP